MSECQFPPMDQIVVVVVVVSVRRVGEEEVNGTKRGRDFPRIAEIQRRISDPFNALCHDATTGNARPVQATLSASTARHMIHRSSAADGPP